MSEKPMKVLVLGGGVIGLSTALAIQNFFGGKKQDCRHRDCDKGCFGLWSYLHKCMIPDLDALQFSNQKVEVTILAENLPPNTTGDIAPGIWSPVFIPDHNPEVATY